MQKLEEVRHSLNRLLGPNGVLSEREKAKMGIVQDKEEPYEAQSPGFRGGGPSGAGARALGGGPNNASKNMLSYNNEYFYNESKKSALDNVEDDFWYGSGKGPGAFDAQPPVAGNEYQSYIQSTQPFDPSILGASSNKPPSRVRNPPRKR